MRGEESTNDEEGFAFVYDSFCGHAWDVGFGEFPVF